jgi:hypothetical protein
VLFEARGAVWRWAMKLKNSVPHQGYEGYQTHAAYMRMRARHMHTSYVRCSPGLTNFAAIFCPHTKTLQSSAVASAGFKIARMQKWYASLERMLTRTHAAPPTGTRARALKVDQATLLFHFRRTGGRVGDAGEIPRCCMGMVG